MNSSGIKRGLAVSAVSALAVAGIPALASSAQAAAGDTITVVSQGPALNGGETGAVVVLRVKDDTVTPANLALTATNSSKEGSQNNSDQSASIVEASLVDSITDDPADSDYDRITIRIATTTTDTGDTATFRIFEDENATDADGYVATLDAGEARATVAISTADELSKIVVSPSSQSVAQGIESGDYTVTLKDAAGRTTQLDDADSVTISAPEGSGITLDPNSYVPAEGETPESGSTDVAVWDDVALAAGTETFTATSSSDTPVNRYTLTVDGPGDIDTRATLNVTAAADVEAGQVDIVTGADSWDGFDHVDDGTTVVRVDQGTIRIDIKDSTPRATVTLRVEGDSEETDGATDVLFGGKKSTTVSTVLDGDGNGSLTITPDQLSVQEGDVLEIRGSFVQDIVFDRAEPTTVEPTTNPYYGQLDGSVDVTVTVVDQFGNPYTSGFVGALVVSGPNADPDAKPQLKPVGADGRTTFTFSDKKANNNDSDVIGFAYYADQFSSASDAEGSTSIKWTADGQGADFATTLDGNDTEATTYDPAKVVVVPLADANAGDDDDVNESVDLDITGVEEDAKVAISVDNGARILAPGDSDLSDGESSVSVTLDGTSLPDGYRVIGTKSGLVTVTVSAANRTETAQFTVAPEVDTTTARNVTVSGPAEVEAGTTQIAYKAVVTDAFGNPVVGLPVNQLNVQVTGPAQFQDSDAVTNAAGEINLNVRVDADAEGAVTIKVQGVGSQFGAAADRLTAASVTDNAEGLPASSSVATATTTVKAGEPEPIGPVYAKMKVQGIDKGKRDVIKVDAVDAASGATVKLFKRKADGSLKKIKTAVLNDAGNFTFRVHDGNGTKATRYTVKLVGNDAVRPAVKSRKVK